LNPPRSGDDQPQNLFFFCLNPSASVLSLIPLSAEKTNGLCKNLNGDIKEGLAKGEHPLKIEPSRVKTGVEFYTFVGKDAVDALKAYLADMRSRGVEFTDKTPLFL
jgi:hypothetical protein